MDKQLMFSMIRHVVTTLGGILTARGIGSSSEWEAVAGGIVALIGFFVFREKKTAAPPVAEPPK